MRIRIVLGLFISIAASAQITPKDTVGPDQFWFTQADFFVAKDHTNAAAWVTFLPGNRGYTGNVGCQTSDGTAIASVDYNTTSNHLYFSYTSNPLALNVPIHCDTNSPDEKTIQVGLSNPSGYPTGQIDQPGSAIIHLLQNTNGTLSFAQASQYASRGGEVIQVRVVRNGPANGSITVRFDTSPGYYDGYGYDMNVTGSAVPGTDFVATNGTLTFGPGETEHSFDLTVLPSDSTNVVWRNIFLMEDYGPNFHIAANRTTVVIAPPANLRVAQVQNSAQIVWNDYGLGFQLERSPDPTFTKCVRLAHSTNGTECVATDSIVGTAFYRLKR
jgi:hypothetical protein